jgi:tRNA 2-thiouridine synthesizing protein A
MTEITMTAITVPDHIDATVDAIGLACPLPILKAKKALSTLSAGQVLLVKTTDKNAKRDFQAFCSQTGNPLLAQAEQDGHLLHYLRRRP